MAKDKEAVEEVKNCPVCKKHLSRAKRYYRDGKYYCNKNCWLTAKKEAAEESSEEKKES